MKILIADDNPVTRNLLQKTLQDWGYEVIVAVNGQKALELFSGGEIKFIIADWMMPVMDGLTLCRIIRSMKGKGYIYFVMLTGCDKQDDIIAGLRAGADDYVTKPFERNELQVRVRAGERILDLERELTEKNESLQLLNLKLEELVRIDTLMGIGNRLSFYETIERMQHRAMRYAYGYGLIMCDIDHFKTYNDTYGHPAGDTVLRRVANSIRNSLRKSDECFRYGGEEIVIVLPDQTLENTVAAAEKVRGNVEAMAIENRGLCGTVTISCGVAAFDKTSSDSNWEQILDRADKAVYKAKALGRNRVCS